MYIEDECVEEDEEDNLASSTVEAMVVSRMGATLLEKMKKIMLANMKKKNMRWPRLVLCSCVFLIINLLKLKKKLLSYKYTLIIIISTFNH